MSVRSTFFAGFCLLGLSVTPASALFIDDFSVNGGPLSLNTAFSGTDEINVAPSIVGGDRGYGLIQRSENGTITTEISNGSLSFDGTGATPTNPNDLSGVNLIYDGNPTSGGFATSNLLNLDLSGFDSFAFNFAFATDNVLLGANVGSSDTLSFVNTGVDLNIASSLTPFTFFVQFADLTGFLPDPVSGNPTNINLFDFSSEVGSIFFPLRTDGAFELVSIEAVSSVPLPAPLLLLLAGVGALLAPRLIGRR